MPGLWADRRRGSMKSKQVSLRDIPSVDLIMNHLAKEVVLQEFERPLLVEKVRGLVDEVRERLKNQQTAEVSLEYFVSELKERLAAMGRGSLCKVVNGTGVVLHTNLGRAPLGSRAVQRVYEVMAGYSNLEYQLSTGERGSRYSHVVDKLCALTGAEDAIVVNNNAAAVLLVLSALARGGEVIVSRGQLVEIGGSFRVPDVLKESGARLVEVGTTNKTHVRDYAGALTENTAAILKVHTSNYRVVGFTSQADTKELAALAQQHKLPLIEDLGSGTLRRLPTGIWQEPTVRECLAEGVDVVTFSGDKLLGAGQAGVIAGKRKYLEKLKGHPLLRAFRIDKLSLAALEGTLLDYLTGDAAKDIPVHWMLERPLVELKKTAEQLAVRLQTLTKGGWCVEVVPLVSQAGGGTLPAVAFDSFGLAITVKGKSAAELEKSFRQQPVPVIVRIQAEQVLLDVRCLLPEDVHHIEAACKGIAEGVQE